ncbi:DUF5131 family protein [Candidatus Bathyarchaeota archaeon]|nr:DUF5131 family protein [Candidatus Bathyarchaeota archaeon]
MSSKIEWLQTDGRPGFTINPVKGLCPVACLYCYARRMYKRFKWNPEIRFDPWWIEGIPKKPSKVFVGSTMELFGEWVNPDCMKIIFDQVDFYPHHTFIFLTKRPENLIRYSPFPANCWVGVSATNARTFIEAGEALEDIKATVKFISVEPLLDWQHGETGYIAHCLQKWGIGWLILGQCTPVNNRTQPNPDWIREIITAANSANIPAFVKDNIINDKVMDLRLQEMRQEFPHTS